MLVKNRTVLRLTQALLVSSAMVVLIGAIGGFVVKNATPEQSQSQPMDPRYTILLFASIDDPYDSDKNEVTSTVRYFQINRAISRSLGHLPPAQPLKIQFKGNKIIDVEVLPTDW